MVVSARVGAGHDGAARELTRRFRSWSWQVDQVDFLDLLPGRIGHLLCSLYRHQLERAPGSWDWILAALDTPLLAAAARGLARLAVPRLARMLDPDLSLAVSTYPLATHALAVALARRVRPVPLVVYLTDPSVHRLSISRNAELTIAPSQIAARQAHQQGARRTIVARPIVAPKFRPLYTAGERDRLRAAFGLPRHTPLALVVAGSWGVGQVEQSTADVAASGIAVPVIVCGHNDSLRRRLAASAYPHVLGWVDNMAELIRACDVVVQNAGGLTASEALASGVPVLTYRCLPGHGRTNAAALDAGGTVPWIRSRDDLARGLATALGARTAPTAEQDRAAAGAAR
ncbi:MAG: glycosyltransferase [Pseudonocardia sp.]|nr:glycosyltransferase [Pseudonocardia sp.]